MGPRFLPWLERGPLAFLKLGALQRLVLAAAALLCWGPEDLASQVQDSDSTKRSTRVWVTFERRVRQQSVPACGG